MELGLKVLFTTTKADSNALKAILDASQLSLSVKANLMPAVIRSDMTTPQKGQYFRKKVTVYAKSLDIADPPLTCSAYTFLYE